MHCLEYIAVQVHCNVYINISLYGVLAENRIRDCQIRKGLFSPKV